MQRRLNVLTLQGILNSMKKIPLILLAIISVSAFAQQSDYAKRKLAEALFEKNNVEAISIYSKMLESGDSSCLSDYASSLYKMRRYKNAYQMYTLSHGRKQIEKPSHITEFLQLTAIFDSTKITSVRNYYEKTLATALYKNIPIGKTNFRYAKCESECYNSDADDLGICPVNNALLFASSRNSTNENIENSIISMYKVKDKHTCKVEQLKDETELFILLEKMKHLYNAGPVNISKDKSKIFITVNQKKADNSGVYNLTILEAHKYKNGTYSELKTVPFSKLNYSCQHPFYDEHFDFLYFASNMPGGAGGYDIYKVKLTDTIFGEPENIVYANTGANEAFPSVDVYGNLYYATKSINGFGGFDIAKIENGKTNGVLLDYPVNSEYDDFGMVITDNRHGYFCSNRPSTKNGDNIYSYAIRLPDYKMKIIVKDSGNKSLLKDVAVQSKFHQSFYKLPDKFDDTTFVLNTNDSGEVIMTFPGNYEGTNWKGNITLVKAGYFENTETELITFSEDRNIIYEKMVLKQPPPKIALAAAPVIELKQVAEKIKVGVDLGKILKLSPIYFDKGKFNITPAAAKELDKIVDAMRELQNMVIELGSHTDSRGATADNQQLSQKRAEASGQYILSKGIDASRLTWIGYGESKPLNKCKDGVKCIEREYAVNRRTEFRIVKM